MTHGGEFGYFPGESVASGSVSVLGRANDAHEYTDAEIVSAGTNLNLYYNGTLLRTRAVSLQTATLPCAGAKSSS